VPIEPCPHCGHPNATDSRFCGECGRELPTDQACQECGYVSSPREARFCIQCGASLQARNSVPVLAWMAGGFVVTILIAAIALWQVGLIPFTIPAILPAARDTGDPGTERIAQGSLEASRPAPTERAASTSESTAATSAQPATSRALSADAAPESTPTGTPTPTPVPSLTPTPSVTPLPRHTATPTPVPSPTPCGIDAYPAVAGIWQENQERLGCPASPAKTGIQMAEENFQRGRMLWRKDNDEIYVLFQTGYWARYEDIWNEGEPEYTCGTPESPPTPKRGFGKIWCTYQNVRDGLGSAVTAEWATTGVAQTYSGGLILRTESGNTHILYNDSTWR